MQALVEEDPFLLIRLRGKAKRQIQLD